MSGGKVNRRLHIYILLYIIHIHTYTYMYCVCVCDRWQLINGHYNRLADNTYNLLNSIEWSQPCKCKRLEITWIPRKLELILLIWESKWVDRCTYILRWNWSLYLLFIIYKMNFRMNKISQMPTPCMLNEIKMKKKNDNHVKIIMLYRRIWYI